MADKKVYFKKPQRLTQLIGANTTVIVAGGRTGKTDSSSNSLTLVEEIEMQQRHKDEAQKKMTSLCEEWFPKEFSNLQTIPGVKERSATTIIAEVGTDTDHFQTPKKLWQIFV